MLLPNPSIILFSIPGRLFDANHLKLSVEQTTDLYLKGNCHILGIHVVSLQNELDMLILLLLLNSNSVSI